MLNTCNEPRKIMLVGEFIKYNNNMHNITRLVIIDHSTHLLYVEDVTEEMLQNYNGDEQAYIDDNYTFAGDYSWDYIIEAYRMLESGDVEPLNFE